MKTSTGLRFPKPEPRKTTKARAKALKGKARASCVEVVFDRAQYRCEDCGRRCYRVEQAPGPLWVGHVHEVKKRSQGGDPTDPANCQLLCYACHARAHDAGKRRGA